MTREHHRALRWLLTAAAIVAAVLFLTGCGARDEALALGLADINAAAQAQTQGADITLTADAIRGHALSGLLLLGYDLSEKDASWLNQRLPPESR